MKNIVIIIFAFLSFSAFAQSNDSLEIVDLKKRVDNLERKLERQIVEIRSQQNALFNQQQKVNDSLKSQLFDQGQKSETLKNDFKQKLDDTNDEMNKNVNTLSENIASNKTIAIIGIIAAIILLAIVFVILRSKISSKDSAIDKIRSAQDSLAAAQKSMQEECVKLDSKLVELLEKQMTAPTVETPKDSEPDHSLALKVADEIIRIETNLSKMDSSVKGYKQLSKAVERIRANFMANGYEIVDMLGKPFSEGMKLDNAEFVYDETLSQGEQKITGIKKPQVNYNGKMIQAAYIKVSQNI